MRKCFIHTAVLLTLSSTAFSQPYLQLHEDAIVADTHNDVLSTANMKGLSIETDLTGKTHSDIARF
jgi:membrane dipeptidase